MNKSDYIMFLKDKALNKDIKKLSKKDFLLDKLALEQSIPKKEIYLGKIARLAIFIGVPFIFVGLIIDFLILKVDDTPIITMFFIVISFLGMILHTHLESIEIKYATQFEKEWVSFFGKSYEKGDLVLIIKD